MTVVCSKGDDGILDCGLLYIPSHKIYVFMATNIGCFIDNKLSAKAREMRDAILMALLQ